MSVGTTATALPSSALANRRSVQVFNNAASGGTTLYVGHSGVTTSSGTPVPAQSAVAFNLGPGVSLYGIVGSGTVDVRVLEIA